MKHIHRWLIVPAILILVVAFLLLTGRVSIDTALPLHTISMVAAVVAGFVLLVTVGLETRNTVKSWELPEPEEPPTSDEVIYPKELNNVVEAVEAVEKADKFSKRATDKVRIEIDIEDARDD